MNKDKLECSWIKGKNIGGRNEILQHLKNCLRQKIRVNKRTGAFEAASAGILI